MYFIYAAASAVTAEQQRRHDVPGSNPGPVGVAGNVGGSRLEDLTVSSYPTNQKTIA
jgi:hypothetical protein